MLSFLKNLFQRALRNPRTISGKPQSSQAEASRCTTSEGEPVSPAVRSFIDGETSSLSASDLDPDNSAALVRYDQACSLKNQGNLEGAARLLMVSCEPPSIYSGHYRLLFQIWRKLNYTDVKEGRYEPVIERVTQMIRYDDEMIATMLAYWGERQNRTLPKGAFDNERNLKISDAKALLSAATALSCKESVTQAQRLIRRL